MTPARKEAGIGLMKAVVPVVVVAVATFAAAAYMNNNTATASKDADVRHSSAIESSALAIAENTTGVAVLRSQIENITTDVKEIREGVRLLLLRPPG